jgi:hypothetical protein
MMMRKSDRSRKDNSARIKIKRQVTEIIAFQISQRRNAKGLPGDANSDWAKAEPIAERLVKNPIRLSLFRLNQLFYRVGINNPQFWIPATYWFLAGLVPNLILHAEFLEINDKYQDFSWHCTSAYSHFFVFPLFFGILFVAFLVKPFRFVMNTPSYRKYRKAFMVLIGFIVVLAFIIEVSGTPAIWEIKPDILQKDTAIIEFFNNPNDTDRDKLIPRYGDKLSSLLIDGKATQNRSPKEYQYLSVKAIKHSSLTRWAYFLSFIIQTFSLIVAFLTFYLFAFIGVDLPKKEREVYRQNATYIVLGLLSGFFWFLMRLIYETKERSLLYGYNGDPGLNEHGAFIWISFLYLFATVCIIASVWDFLGSTLKSFASIVTFLISLGFFEVVTTADQLRQTFGRNPAPQHYVVHFLVFVLVMCVPCAYLIERIKSKSGNSD